MSAEFLALRDVVRITKFSRSQVRRLVVAGIFPEPARITGPSGRPYWLAATVEEWMLSRAGRSNA